MDTEVSQAPPTPRIRRANREGEVNRPQCIDDLIDEDHRARIVWDFVDGLDLSDLYTKVKSVEDHPGRPAIDAKILFAVWLYATLDGETSARRISIFCKEFNPYIWLCGGIEINHHTLSDFYTSHADYLEKQFTLHLACLSRQGLVDLETVAQDGMRASAGAASFRRKKTLEESLEAAKEHMAELVKQRAENPHVTDKRRQAAKERVARERCQRIAEAQRQIPDVEAKKAEKDGSPMKGATLRAKMIDLEISPSYSRPRVSNDNPYSESLFKTVKYHDTFPEDPFTDLSEARDWVERFVHWYNDEHQHSAIKYVTPNQRHSGLDRAILENRKKIIEQAKKRHPERWNRRNTRNLTPIKTVFLNPSKDDINPAENELKLKNLA